MPGSGDRRSSPMGSARSSAVVSSSRASGTNWRAMGSRSSLGSTSSAISGVIATAKRPATAANSGKRAAGTSPASASSAGRRSVRLIMRPLDVGVDMGLRLGAGMGDGALLRVAHGLRVFPQGARLIVVLARLPGLAPRRQLGIAELDIERARLGIDGDDVAVAQQADRAADRRFRADMADAEAAGGTREAAVGDERHLVAHALAVDRRRRRQHLAHAGAAARPFIADDDDLTRLVVACLD